MKPIVIPDHAAERMLVRGATFEQIESTVRTADPIPAKNERLSAKKTFDYHSISPVNHKYYDQKTVEVVWVDEPLELVLVTVKVYYHN